MEQRTNTTYSEHSTECKSNLQSTWNKKNGLFIHCGQCNKYVSKINTNPTQMQKYPLFILEISQLIPDHQQLYDEMVTSYKEIPSARYGKYFAKSFKILHATPNTEWFFSTWSEDDLDWDKFPNWTDKTQENYEKLNTTHKQNIEKYVLAIDDVIRKSAYPYKLYLLGYDVVVIDAEVNIKTIKNSGDGTLRHYDDLYNGNPWIILIDGKSKASPGHVNNKFKMPPGSAYSYLDWKWHDKKHGYINYDGMDNYKLILKYLNPEIIYGIAKNIGDKLDHEFLLIDTKKKTLNYKRNYIKNFSNFESDEEEDTKEDAKEKKKKKQKILEDII